MGHSVSDGQNAVGLYDKKACLFRLVGLLLNISESETEAAQTHLMHAKFQKMQI